MARRREDTSAGIRVVAGLFRLTTRALARVSPGVTGEIPLRGPALVVLNHCSHLDPLYDAIFVYQAGRMPRFFAKHTLWRRPVVRRLLESTGQIPVSRGSAGAVESLRVAAQVIGDGKVVLIYPEGTLTRDPEGWPMRSYTGVARLALEHDIPVIPVARWGTRDIYDQYRRKFRPFPRKRVVYRVGDAIDLSPYRDRPADRDTLRDVTDLIMGRVRDLLGEIRGQEPPSSFAPRVPRSSAEPRRKEGDLSRRRRQAR